MPVAFVASLAATVAALLVLRRLVPGLPLRRAAAPLSVAEAIVAAMGVIGLAWHCGAMFYRPLVGGLPGTGVMIDQINAMGVASLIWYAVPAVLLLVGLRRQHAVAVVAMAVALLAVGVTMYDDGPLPAHLAAIFASVVVLAAVVSLLIVPPWRRRPVVSGK
ncbi:hypothetical protein ACQCSX_17710 [Pseudarthrobacter sp. P1]|uniref:hypothetical protein n=1 Tax=Pseudarthrobacter sp. P1 TaxID=3418418 RepID=UPI003CEDDB17